MRNDIVQMQNIGCDGVNLICRQRFLIPVGHRAINIVKQGGCVGPVAAYRLVRPAGGEAADAAGDGVAGQLAIEAMAGGAMPFVEFLARLNRSGTGWCTGWWLILWAVLKITLLRG